MKEEMRFDPLFKSMLVRESIHDVTATHIFSYIFSKNKPLIFLVELGFCMQYIPTQGVSIGGTSKNMDIESSLYSLIYLEKL